MVLKYDYFDETLNQIISRLFVITNTFDFLELSSSMELVFQNLNFGCIPNYFYENEKLLILSPNTLFVVIDKNNTPYCITSYPDITHYSKISNNSYLILKNKKFSVFECDELDLVNLPSSIADYQEIALDYQNGTINNILEFDNCLFAIQQYEVNKITYSGGVFKTLSTNYFSSKIYGETAVKMNDCIVFLTSSGLYLFDGNDAKQIFSNITKFISFDKFSAVSFNDKYFLTTNYYVDGIKENVILEFDIQNSTCTIHKTLGIVENLYVIKTASEYSLCASVSINDEYFVLTFDNTKTSEQEKSITFNKISFDSNNFKIVKSINICGTGEYSVCISSEHNEITLRDCDCLLMHNLGLKGQFFKLEIFSNKPFIIDCINFEVEYVEEK